jgi:translation initiation factor 1A
MVRNFGKGGKGCKKMKNSAIETNRILLFKDAGQEYAIVEDIYGHGRYKCMCQDNVSRLCILRGSLRKGSVRICKQDTVLVSLRDFQDDKADIIHVYTQDEVRSLSDYGEIQNRQEEFDSDIEFIN